MLSVLYIVCTILYVVCTLCCLYSILPILYVVCNVCTHPNGRKVVVLVEPLKEHAEHGDLPHIAVPGLGGGTGVTLLASVPCFATLVISLTVSSLPLVMTISASL